MKSTSNAVVGGWVALTDDGVGMIELSPRHDAERVDALDESDRSELAESDDERERPPPLWRDEDVGAVEREAYDTSDERDGDRVRIDDEAERVWTRVRYDAASCRATCVCEWTDTRGQRGGGGTGSPSS